MFEQRATLADHLAIDCPVTLARGRSSPKVAAAVFDVLASSLKDVRVIELVGTGHISPFTYPGQVRARVEAHLAHALQRLATRHPERMR